ncbi:MAG: FRG domain-containing protein [Verrucomicrobiota bacterium]
MQHFGCPTRLCDFTSDFWMALFFASDHATEAKDLCLYRLCANDEQR